jgi:hypothetical protein
VEHLVIPPPPGPAADKRLTFQPGRRQPGVLKDLPQPQPELAVNTERAVGVPDPFAELLQHRYGRERGAHPGEVRFLEHHDATGVQVRHQPAEHCDGITEVQQDQPADYGVEPCLQPALGPEFRNVCLDERHVGLPAGQCVCPRGGQHRRVAVDPGHRSCPAHQFGGQERHRPGAAADIEHVHSLGDPGLSQRLPGAGLKKLAQFLQPRDLRGGAAEHVGACRMARLGHNCSSKACAN